MKKRKGFINRFIVLCMMLTLVFCNGVYADSNICEIHITLGAMGGESNPENVRFEIYKVGTVNEHGKAELDAVYGMSTYPETSAQMAATARIIAANNHGTLVTTITTDAHGYAEATSLGYGVYLCVAVNAENYGVIEPFLINLPYLQTGSDAGNLGYTVDVEPKATPEDPDESDETSQSDETEESKESDETNETSGDAPKTGDETPMKMLIVIAGIALVCIGLIVVLKLKTGKEEE